MKTALLAASMMLLSETPATAQSPVDPVIRAIIERQIPAWGKDAAAWTNDFLDDARFINVRGDSFVGKAGIERVHAVIFGGPYKDTHCAVKFVSATMLSPDMALIETLTTISGFKALPPGLTPTRPGELDARLTYLLARQDGVWKIRFAQNTAVSPVPMAVK